MKSTWILIVGIAIGVLGASAYLSTSSRSNAPENQTAETERGSESHATRTRETRRKSLWPQWKPTDSKKTTARQASPTQPAKESTRPTPAAPTTRPLVKNDPRPLDATDEPTYEELAVHAEQIQKRATRELARLTRLLDLSEEQQDRIFPLLARSTTVYHPSLGIQVGNSETSAPSTLRSTPSSTQASNTNTIPTPDPPADTAAPSAPDPNRQAAPEPADALTETEAQEQIHEILTDEQQQALEDELIDEDLWWSDIVAELEQELDESTQVETATETTTESEDVEYTGNSGIGSLLPPPADD